MVSLGVPRLSLGVPRLSHGVPWRPPAVPLCSPAVPCLGPPPGSPGDGTPEKKKYTSVRAETGNRRGRGGGGARERRQVDALRQKLGELPRLRRELADAKAAMAEMEEALAWDTQRVRAAPPPPPLPPSDGVTDPPVGRAVGALRNCKKTRTRLCCTLRSWSWSWVGALRTDDGSLSAS